MTFSKDFIWGAAAASYQIEGNTQGIDGCAESVWDMSCRRKGFVRGGDNGSVACDHYHRFKEDVQVMKQMGLKAYRLSIMWPRIMPNGTGEVNEAGLRFYDELIDELLLAGIEPWITLFHWDHPAALFYRGGWLNPGSSQWFEEYARVIVNRYSDRVSHWFTLNEQACFIGLGHQAGVHAPGLQLPTKEVNMAWHNALLAHGKAVKVIRENATLEPKIGAAPCFRTSIPASDDPRDIAAAEKYMFSMVDDQMFNATWWMDPAFKGEYPQDGLALFGDDAPAFTQQEMETICQPLDFVGFNVYQSATIKADENGEPIIVEYPNDYPRTHFDWPVTPESLKWGSKFLYERYQLPIVVTENGLSTNDWVSIDGKVHDYSRIDFLNRYLLGLKEAIVEGVDVRGYFQWSIFDNFEWALGYRERFGLVHVDYATQERTIKESGYWYKGIIESNGDALQGESPTTGWRKLEDFNRNLKG